MYYNMDFETWLNQNVNKYDYAIIDPPWNYDDKPPSVTNNQLTYNVWENLKLRDIYVKLDVDYIFLWVTTQMLPLMFDCCKNTKYEFKSLIPWIKLTSKDSLFYGLGNTFRNCVEYVAVFQKSGCSVLRLSERNIIFEEVGKRTIKPKNWERNLVSILSNKHLNGVYIFSGGNLDFIDCVDIVQDTKTTQRRNLF